MSNSENSHDDHVPRFEPWLGVMAAAIVPAIGTVYLPGQFIAPLVAAAVILFAAGLFMLRRQKPRKAEGAES